jgi:hypothetical protein
MSGRQRIVATLGGALAVVSLTVPTMAQDVAGANLRAEYIYRFADFTQWPAPTLPQGSSLTMCVVGDTAVRDALERNARGGVTVADRRVVVAYGTPDKPPASCHLLWVSAISPAQTARVVSGFRDLPVLTMSDLEGFNRMGGIAEFFYDNALLRFSIDLEALKKSPLQLSSRVLLLSRPRR